MKTIEFKQHPLINALWLIDVGEQTIGTLHKEDGTVTIFEQTILSPKMIHQITEQIDIDYCLAQNK